MLAKQKKAIVSVINDLVTDNRVAKTCDVLMESGFEVQLIGRVMPSSLPLPQRPYKMTRMHLLFRSGPLFYLFFNVRLFLRLLFSKADLLFANDLDTLWPNYVVSKLKGIPLIYDSHELFCEVPELMHSPMKKKIWQHLESAIVPKLKTCITVSSGIAEVFQKQYHVNFHVIRNIPPAMTVQTWKTREELGLPSDKKIILLQGAGINIQRGAEELVQSMKQVNDAMLLIIGGGDVWNSLNDLVKQHQLETKVRMISKLPKQELINYTHVADLGISIDKNTNPNYYFSLPNKIFDYIQHELPILASKLYEIEKIIREYNIGEFIDSHEPAHIAERLNDLLQSNRLSLYRANMRKAADALTWEQEKKKYLEILAPFRN